MKIIADEETCGLYTSALAIDWNLSSICQIRDCNNNTYAILCYKEEETNDNGNLRVTICKEHYFDAKEGRNTKFMFDL